MRSLRPWRAPSSWGGSSSPSTTAGSSQTNCSSSWRWRSSSPRSSTSSRRDCSPSCRPGTVWGALSARRRVQRFPQSPRLIPTTPETTSRSMSRHTPHYTQVPAPWHVDMSQSQTATLMSMRHFAQKNPPRVNDVLELTKILEQIIGAERQI